MSVKGKTAVACMFLVLVILWSYAPLASADDDDNTVEYKYKLYNIHIKFYDDNNHGLQITTLTIPRGGTDGCAWYTVFNNSPLPFILIHAKSVYIWSNGKKSVYWWGPGFPNLAFTVPRGGTFSYSFCFAAPSDAPLGKGTLKWIWYGCQYRGPAQYQCQVPYMKSYPGKLTITVTS